MELVWIPAFGTPAARMAATIAPTRRFAADSATADLAADRATDTDNDATSGVTITDPGPSTLSVDGEVASAAAADAKISDKTATTATTATIRTGIKWLSCSFGGDSGTQRPQIPCYPVGSQAPRPTSKLRASARPRPRLLRPSHPSPAGDHLSHQPRFARSTGSRTRPGHRRHLLAALLNWAPTGNDSIEGRIHGGPDSARPQRVNAWSLGERLRRPTGRVPRIDHPDSRARHPCR